MNMVATVDRNAGSGRVVTACRMCAGSGLDQVLDLGFSPLADRFLTREQLSEPELYFPLRVLLCNTCGLVQLDYVVDRVRVYQDNYPYESSVTATGRNHFLAMAREICEAHSLPASGLAVDIGSNVGVLLSGFREKGLRVVGVEPAPNIAAKARENGIETICDFFGSAVAGRLVGTHGPASVVTATNVFAHVDDLDDLMRSVQALLSPRGIFVIEAPYLVDLVNRLEYDTIYHEHLSYLSVRPISRFFERHGMQVFDVQRVPIHGGSLRIFAGRAGERQATARVRDCLALEAEQGVHSMDRLRRFSRDVAAHRVKLTGLLLDLKRKGARIAGISAPAKGNALLNACRIGPDVLDYLTEKSQLKKGLYAPGTHLPIVGDERLLEDPPDYAMILAWNFGEEIRANLKGFEQKGRRFIIPLPEPAVL